MDDFNDFYEQVKKVKSNKYWNDKNNDYVIQPVDEPYAPYAPPPVDQDIKRYKDRISKLEKERDLANRLLHGARGKIADLTNDLDTQKAETDTAIELAQKEYDRGYEEAETYFEGQEWVIRRDVAEQVILAIKTAIDGFGIGIGGNRPAWVAGLARQVASVLQYAVGSYTEVFDRLTR